MYIYSFLLSCNCYLIDFDFFASIQYYIRDGYNYAKPMKGMPPRFSSMIKNTVSSEAPFDHLCELFRVVDPFANIRGRQLGVSMSFSKCEVNWIDCITFSYP